MAYNFDELTDEEKKNRDRQFEDAKLIGDLRTENALLKAENEELTKGFEKLYEERRVLVEQKGILEQENNQLKTLNERRSECVESLNKINNMEKTVCSVCGLVNHASVKEYEKLFIEIMSKEPKKQWTKEELFSKVNYIAITRKHKELNLI